MYLNGIKRMREVKIMVKDDPSVPVPIRGAVVDAAIVPSDGRQVFTFNTCGSQWVADSSVVNIVDENEEEREVE